MFIYRYFLVVKMARKFEKELAVLENRIGALEASFESSEEVLRHVDDLVEYFYHEEDLKRNIVGLRT